MPLESWVQVSDDSDFPLENLPFGVFSHNSGPDHIGVALGEHVIDLFKMVEAGHLEEKSLKKSTLNDFMSCGSATWKSVRGKLQNLFSVGQPDAMIKHLQTCMHLISEVEMKMPAKIWDYT